MLAGGPGCEEIEKSNGNRHRVQVVVLDKATAQGDHGVMEVNDRGHDHLFGTGAHPDPHTAETLGLEQLADDSQHHAVSEVHGLIEHAGVDISHFADNLSHLPELEHHDGIAGIEHDFGTHHDAGDGFHGLHDSIHQEATHLGFDEHHGLADLAHDTHHDDPLDHHHHDGFGLGH